MIRARQPDLVLLGLIMPVMTGEEVLSVMEADPALRAAPVVVISTRAPVGPGVNREVPHLRKPFGPADVKRLVRGVPGDEG
jgi:CheY-like chemotaxis protein